MTKEITLKFDEKNIKQYILKFFPSILGILFFITSIITKYMSVSTSYFGGTFTSKTTPYAVYSPIFAMSGVVLIIINIYIILNNKK